MKELSKQQANDILLQSVTHTEALRHAYRLGQQEAQGQPDRVVIASQQMAALLGDVEVSKWVQADPRYNGENFKEVLAANAVEFTDALIAELNRTKNQTEK